MKRKEVNYEYREITSAVCECFGKVNRSQIIPTDKVLEDRAVVK